MTSFCTKCGAAVPPDTQFCPNCGTPMAAPAPTTAPPAYAPVSTTPPAYTPVGTNPQYPPAYPAAAAPVPSGGSSAVKIILIILAIFIGLGLIGAGIFAFTIWRVSRAIHVEGNGSDGKMTLSTPGGSISADTSKTYSSSELGTDPYPGASKSKGGMKMDLPTGSMVSSVYTTSDSKDQVLAYYKDKLGSKASVIDTQDGAIITLAKDDKETVMVTINAKPDQNDGKTQIAIVHTKSNK